MAEVVKDSDLGLFLCVMQNNLDHLYNPISIPANQYPPQYSQTSQLTNSMYLYKA